MIDLDPLELQLFRELTGSKEVLVSAYSFCRVRLLMFEARHSAKQCQGDILRRLACCFGLIGRGPAKSYSSKDVCHVLFRLAEPFRVVSDVPSKSPAELEQSINVFGEYAIDHGIIDH